jgi:hypothetical protein
MIDMTDHPPRPPTPDDLEEMLKLVTYDPQHLRSLLFRTCFAVALMAVAYVAMYFLNPPPLVWLLTRILLGAGVLVALTSVALVWRRQREVEAYLARHADAARSPDRTERQKKK